MKKLNSNSVVTLIRRKLWYLRAKYALSATMRKGEPPILVHQMGKVGSTSLASELRKCSALALVYQTHFLSQQGFDEAIAVTEGWGRGESIHLKVSAQLMPYLDLPKREEKPWRVVTSVRDPVARQLSDAYQNPQVVGLPRGVTPDPLQVLEYLKQYFINFDETQDYACRWFQREIIDLLGVRVYESAFPVEQKYQILEQAGVRLLLFRVEDSEAVFNDKAAFNQWLGQSVDLNMSKANSAADRASYESYKKVKADFKLPREVLEKVYSTQFARHFYGDRREALIDSWSS